MYVLMLGSVVKHDIVFYIHISSANHSALRCLGPDTSHSRRNISIYQMHSVAKENDTRHLSLQRDIK